MTQIEIKFKVWEIDEKRFVDYYSLSNNFVHVAIGDQYYLCNNLNASEEHKKQLNEKGIEIRDEFILCQFTGLQSSEQGCGMPIKDAYFGDIIEFFNTDGKRIVTEIIWYDKEHCIGFKRISDGFVYTQRIFNDSGYFQPSKIQFNIIGNIYETPELLK